LGCWISARYSLFLLGMGFVPYEPNEWQKSHPIYHTHKQSLYLLSYVTGFQALGNLNHHFSYCMYSHHLEETGIKT
jgi:hypothetical protein